MQVAWGDFALGVCFMLWVMMFIVDCGKHNDGQEEVVDACETELQQQIELLKACGCGES
jgi:uracil-DNA glycosylase